MGWLSVNNNYKYRAEGAIREAEELVEIQQEADFGKNLLSNIRQYRIAKQRLEAYGDTDDISSSTTAGVVSNVKSTLAGEVGYAYETSNRAEQIQKLQTFAQQQMNKYSQQVKRASRNADIVAYGAKIVGAAIGFVFGGGPAGAAAGWQIGGMLAAPTTFVLGGDSVAMRKNLGVSVASAASYGVSSYLNAPGGDISAPADAGVSGGTKVISTSYDTAGNTFTHYDVTGYGNTSYGNVTVSSGTWR